ncbi:hypothetical protein D7193_11385 [Micromonospora costi]|uniref:Uncharacterized protein n=2 Tax=Micromonospora costi TaxID=1530042 RepID=A0A3B0A490_9ACTN|nr:hypothetical protein D7193_11385 [Micromonospora costi]
MRQRRLPGVDGMATSLSATGLTTGEIRVYLVKVSGADVSRQSSRTITDEVVEGAVPSSPMHGTTVAGLRRSSGRGNRRGRHRVR